MALTAGTRVGPYEINAEIGAGGMGVVYRARDTKLGRDVALKVLPETFAADPDRVARFKREAHVLAALNHPNIAAIYGFEDGGGEQALVLELVEGPTLADRIARGPISLDEALPIARQIAEALEAAHEQGIIHRDLKPANIKVRDDGIVKVLDFGLAKALETQSAMASADVSMSPTISAHATYAGVILGTAAYMSPEQARGKVVDKRSDIWAFGCVLYEMLTGRQTFGTGELSDTLAFILTKEPDWTALPQPAPPTLSRLLRRCLEKDRKRRLADIADARLDIDEALAASLDGAHAPAASVAAGHSRLAWRLVAALGVMFVVAVSATVVYLRPTADDTSTYRSTLLPPAGTTLLVRGLGVDRLLAVSPDGLRLAFVAIGEDGRRLLWVRTLDTLIAQPLAGTENAQIPFWSPDSRWLGFFVDGQLKKIEAAGGAVLTLCRYSGIGGGATWNRNGVILFSDSIALHRVAASGGPASLVMRPDSAAGGNYQWPFFLPDGQHFLYRGPGNQTFVASLDSTEGKLIGDGNNVQYAQGYLISPSAGTLMAQRFDVARLQLTGETVLIAQDVRSDGSNGAFSVSEAGVLVYQTAAATESRLVWFDRAGKQTGVLGERGDYGDLELSPDGTQAVVTLLEPGQSTRDMWLFDIARELRTKFTFDLGNEVAPAWSPDGQSLIFDSDRQGNVDLYEKPADNTREERLVLGGQGMQRASSWHPDGRQILYLDQGGRLSALPMVGERKPVRVLEAVPTPGVRARFSPDGQWIAYTSSESGRAEVYVTPYPGVGGKSLVSTAGGSWPRWRRDGKELFYLDLNGALIAADVNAQGSTFRVGPVRSLFQLRSNANRRTIYDVSPDGQRFLVIEPAEEAATSPLALVVNWPALLRQP